MKTFRMIGTALVTAVIAFAFSACEKDGKEDYKDYPQLIVGKWFNFSPDASVFLNLSADGIYNMMTDGDKNIIFQHKIEITPKDIEEIPFLKQLKGAIQYWENKVKTVMSVDFSWRRSMNNYVKVYKEIQEDNRC